MRSKITSLITGLLLTLGVVGVVSTPASAAPVVTQVSAPVEGWQPIGADLPRVAVGMTPVQEAAIVKAAQARFASDCIIPRHCVWTNNWFNGAPAYYWTIPGTPAGGYCIPYAGSLNDNVRSAVLKGGRSATMYEHAGCTGTIIFFLAQPGYGGPLTGTCGDYTGDNWSCLGGTIQASSVWIIRIGT